MQSKVVYLSGMVAIGALFCTSLVFALLFFVSLCSYDYLQIGYYPSLGNGIMNLFMVLLTFVNTYYFATAAWLLLKLR